MHFYHRAPYLAFGKRGTTANWKKTYDFPRTLEPDEIEDAIVFVDRCGHLGDLRFYDVVTRLGVGAIYQCGKCDATWIIGEL